MNLMNYQEPESAQPRHLMDVIDKDAVKGLSPQQLSKYRHHLNKEWKSYVAQTNIDFLSQNKLYLKSMQDYLTREYKAPKSRIAAAHNLPKIRKDPAVLAAM